MKNIEANQYEAASAARHETNDSLFSLPSE